MEFEHFRPCRNSLHSCRKSCHHFAQKRPVEKRWTWSTFCAFGGQNWDSGPKVLFWGLWVPPALNRSFPQGLLMVLGCSICILVILRKDLGNAPLECIFSFFEKVEALLGILCLFLSPWVQKSRKCYHFCFKSMLQMASGRKVQQSTFCGLNFEWK